MFVGKAEYEEHGRSNLCRQRFGGPDLGPDWSPDRGLADVSEGELSSSSSGSNKAPKLDPALAVEGGSAVEGVADPLATAAAPPKRVNKKKAAAAARAAALKKEPKLSKKQVRRPQVMPSTRQGLKSWQMKTKEHHAWKG
jgi:hypothetical protein